MPTYIGGKTGDASSVPDLTFTGANDTISVGNGADVISLTDMSYTYGTDTISSGIPSVTIGPYTTTTTNTSGGGYVLGSNGALLGSNGWVTGGQLNLNQSGKLSLNGDDADIEINGESLVTMLKNIEQRLNILKPSTELESEWEELRKLGEQYRALEKHIQEKMATWDTLKRMPPPIVE